MKPFSAQDLADATSGELHGIAPDTQLSAGVVTDSRDVAAGDVYVARRGEHADGLDFAPAAIDAGAALIVAEAVPSVDGEHLPTLLVQDATEALGHIARHNVETLRAEGDLTVVAITGSTGKTTVKDLVGDLLSAAGETVWPPKSFNNEVGVPLTALRADESTRFLVLEMGARSIGNLTYLTSMVTPDIAVELMVGTAHSGMFGSIENTARAKTELVESLRTGGTAVLNADDPRVRAMADVLADGVDVIWFSASGRDSVEGSDAPVVSATDSTTGASGRPTFTLAVPGGEPTSVELALLGEHHVANALAAAAVAHRCGLSQRAIITTLRTSGAASRWRMELIDSPQGITVLNDAYNANPDSMRSALKTLAAMGRGDEENPARRTIAVIGEMLELGEGSREAHADIGELVVRLNIDRTIAVGDGARPVFQAAELEGSWGNEAVWVSSLADARELLRSELQSGDIVLFKSSNDAGLRFLGDEIAGVTVTP
ncbi:UDP-N-acetylmuramoyl-tripeptide--D-alanyl-D-alanine ligase [Brevibacterium jeotgali]|uniref:UDP-N-acetylmuramoyl-tripeptide--D-alanyl-D-alanine ligase n=1 Tax=Brevibacterium jeotgali TaxID=1262550 RepID=A0A2H1L6R0_9MICO|nr:UDP-N-acetylmuramoyl-tripeptide--D-alanyl-D-alanine ligase [Brevibacterium jeotgali]TWC02649.1 UDP-N-acetylmuramoyl-tripeptide--D-alanyl-D-alanine ligase [Brevibacterium jeotgali]SMY12559.1 UDP-N-acetylmuramoyl-tripeptide--D-alanyl-D-alanine ligase [Brevibacterium jeotgali]